MQMDMYVDKSNADRLYGYVLLKIGNKGSYLYLHFLYIWYIDFQLMVLILTYVKSTLSTSALSDENST